MVHALRKGCPVAVQGMNILRSRVMAVCTLVISSLGEKNICSGMFSMD